MHKYGYLKDPHDHRDLKFRAVHAPQAAIELPTQVSLRSKFKQLPWDQGQLGACSAHAALGVYSFVHEGGPWSRLALYYWERLMEGTVDQDSGAYLRDAIKVLANTGVGLESDWPYDISKFTVEPDTKELNEAQVHRITTYSRLETLQDYKECLAQGFPYMTGIQIYESFESEEVAQTGIIAMPEPFENNLGGHAVCVIGYDDNFRNTGNSYFEVRNSWGTEWGDHGHFWLPSPYMESETLTTDAWTIRR